MKIKKSPITKKSYEQKIKEKKTKKAIQSKKDSLYLDMLAQLTNIPHFNDWLRNNIKIETHIDKEKKIIRPIVTPKENIGKAICPKCMHIFNLYSAPAPCDQESK